jgi:hypothetical protein
MEDALQILFLFGYIHDNVVGRGMNAAFAIGRLCDMDAGVVRLLSLPQSDKMVRVLYAFSLSF